MIPVLCDLSFHDGADFLLIVEKISIAKESVDFSAEREFDMTISLV